MPNKGAHPPPPQQNPPHASSSTADQLQLHPSHLSKPASPDPALPSGETELFQVDSQGNSSLGLHRGSLPFEPASSLTTTNIRRFYPAQLTRLCIAQRYLQRWLLIGLLQQQILCYSCTAETSRDPPGMQIALNPSFSKTRTN